MTPNQLALAADGSAESRGAGPRIAESTGAGPLDGGPQTLSLFGVLSHGSAHLLEAEIERLCRIGIAALVLDLSRLESIDWTGVRVIAFRHWWCRRHGCELSLIPGPAHVQRMFDQENLSECLPFLLPDHELRSTHAPGRLPGRSRSLALSC